MKHYRIRLLICTIFTIFYPTQGWTVPSEGSQIMVSGPSQHMVDAVREITTAGGNVADAAVVSLLTLAVTSPYFAALGGGGFAMIKIGTKVEVLDFRETAPGATHKQFYETKAEGASTKGGAAVGIPGVPAGLWALHKRHGKLPWKRLFETPLRLAQSGFRVSGEWATTTKEEMSGFNAGGMHFFVKPDKSPYQAGDLLKQVSLAQALIELRNKGAVGFYQGAVANDIAKSVTNTGGAMTLADLKAYRVRWLEPLVTEFKGYKFYLMPPPSSGGVVLRTAFQLADKLNLGKLKPYSVDELHLLGEILHRAFRGRTLLGDPDFHKNPLPHLASPAYLTELSESIRADKTTTLPALMEAPPESSQTTHFSIVDRKGSAIALTVTLNGSYGSGVVSERFGVALNNEMDDFTTKPGAPNMFGLIQGDGNAVQAGKRPLSSMSPTLVEQNGEIILAAGAPGGPRIISAVFQAAYRHLMTGLDVDQAVQAPRIHHQFLPNTLWMDLSRFTPETVDGLTGRGHQIAFGGIGRVYMVRRNKDGTLHGAFDSRGEGAAGGY